MHGAFWRCCLLVVIAFAASHIGAAPQTWNGDSLLNAHWSNGENWVGDPLAAAVPGTSAGDTATFPSPGTWMATIDVASPASVDNVAIASDTSLTLERDLTFNNLTVTNNSTLTFAGSGRVVIATHSLAGATINIASANVTLAFATPLNLVGLTGFTNNGMLELQSSATLSTNATIDLGRVNIVGNVNIGGSLMTSATLSISGAANVVANDLDLAGLQVGDASTLSSSLASTIRNSIELDGSATFASGLSFEGATININAGGILNTGTGTDLTLANPCTLTLDRSGEINVGAQLIVSAALQIQNSDALAIGSGTGEITIGTNFVVNAAIADSNTMPSLRAAARIEVANALRIADNAGFSVLLDECEVVFIGPAATMIQTQPTQANFDGQIAIGHLITRANFMLNAIPPTIDVLLGSLTQQNNSSVTFSTGNIVLSGAYTNTGAGALNGTIRAGANLRGVSEIS
ncbi:MAG: hypothetical protein KDB07_10010, partial [Planctomycetes bacterium]|nr:hypothetical protein [Planctomycetota bacterium]